MAWESALSQAFYASLDTLTLAKRLLGCELVHESKEGITAGVIVETEAYLHDDPACHAYNRKTLRTEPMYGAAGTIYVYLIYGMYQCVNVVSNRVGVGEAVLIRALEPTKGVPLMEARRNRIMREKKTTKPLAVENLCNGPGKLAISMGIDRSLHNNKRFSDSELYITPAISPVFDIDITTRIGISVGVDLPYRFSIHKNSFVSKGNSTKK
jgi:DNA-3-methyladenine glycosylase